MRAQYATLAILLASAFVCHRETPVAPSKTILILVDRSESVRRAEIESRYLADMRTILGAVGHGDVIVAGWITDRSATELELPLNHEIPRFDPGTDNPMVRDAKQRESDTKLAGARAELASSFEQLFRSDRRVGRTDIIGSLELAPRVFASYPRDRKVLVILSDMVEDSDRFNFERETLSTKRVESIVATLREQKAIPDLQGVRVVVSGAMHRDNERFRRIRDFWFRFFEEAGAVMKNEDYGTALIRFDA